MIVFVEVAEELVSLWEFSKPTAADTDALNPA
jgi:hypothetical protein